MNNSALQSPQSLQSSIAIWSDRDSTYFLLVKALPRASDASLASNAALPKLPKNCGFAIMKTEAGTFAYVLLKVPSRRLAARLTKIAKASAVQLAQIWTWLRRLLVAGGVAFVGMVAGCDKFPVTAPAAAQEALVAACTASRSLCRDAGQTEGLAKPYGPTNSDRLLARHRA